MNKEDILEVGNSQSFVSVYAEMAGCTLYTVNGGTKMATLLFMNNDIVPHQNAGGAIVGQDFRLQKVASVTMTHDQAKKLYETLKTQFENQG